MEKLRKMKTKKSVKKFLYEYQNPLQKWVFKSKSLNAKKKEMSFKTSLFKLYQLLRIISLTSS